MSATLIESPVHGSAQLFFHWPETDHTSEETLSNEKTQVEVAAAPPLESIRTRPSMVKAATALDRSPMGEVHQRGEVRIGSVMIKLLKRYGITDAEIEEGLADYAKKTCQSVAS